MGKIEKLISLDKDIDNKEEELLDGEDFKNKEVELLDEYTLKARKWNCSMERAATMGVMITMA